MGLHIIMRLVRRVFTSFGILSGSGSSDTRKNLDAFLDFIVALANTV